MLFTTILITILSGNITTTEGADSEIEARYFKNLKTFSYQDQMIEKRTFTYTKVPTKMIKIDKNSI